ncbi:hypothetical protein SAMN02983003_1464 [Devosia enhydra]|uniref:Protease inhibitor Inh n=1 Tax=Devosia enhydra TaxID=665118 RepID=A0A1K2HXQ3_9HYPH|nr:hypothetical protein [Devosia enhydra]SFZ83113.1 hypothetical protein SAMN02983003_1464 [Devosia enhydra]
MALRRILLSTTLLLALAGTATAQISPVEGNWACIADIDGSKSGILTVFAGSYGYASANYQSAASGTGNAQLASDGLTFIDGNLREKAGVEVGLLSFDAEARDVLVLRTVEKPILTCRPRRP